MEIAVPLNALTARSKHSYSTTHIFKYQLGLLSSEEKKSIPSSTRHEWKNRRLDNIIGFNPDEPFLANAGTLQRIAEQPTLLHLNETFIKVIDFYKSVVDELRSHKKIWKKHRKTVLLLAEELKQDLGIEKACGLLRISTQRFYRWKKDFVCTTSVSGLCRRLHPGQLTTDEQNTVKNYVTDPQNSLKHLIQIYYQMMHDGAAHMAEKTFYAYANLYRKQSNIPRKKKYKTGIRASAPFRLLHMDTTLLRTLDGTRVYIHFIVDNFSRVILGWKASLDSGSINPAENLRNVCERYNLFNKEIELMCDDGSENKGEVYLFLERSDVLIKQIIAQIQVLFSNSISEAANKSVKYLFLFPQKPRTFDDVVRILDQVIPIYNDSYPFLFYGRSRNDVLSGKIPDKHLFSEKIRQAKLNRLDINRSNSCGVC